MQRRELGFGEHRRVVYPVCYKLSEEFWGDAVVVNNVELLDVLLKKIGITPMRTTTNDYLL
jgi:hypothetical protein